MVFVKKVISGCNKLELTTPTFIRITNYQIKKEQDITLFVESSLQCVWQIKQALAKNEIVIEKLSCQKNQQAVLLSGRFNDKTLFNVSLALYTSIQEPLYKIEVVAANGMLQYDTSADNSFTSFDYALDYLATKDKSQNVNVFLKQFDFSLANFGKVVV